MLIVRFLPARVKCDMRMSVQVLKIRVSLTAFDMQQTVIICSLHCNLKQGQFALKIIIMFIVSLFILVAFNCEWKI